MGVMEYFYTQKEIEEASKNYKLKYELLLRFADCSDSWADMMAHTEFRVDLNQYYQERSTNNTLNESQPKEQRVSLSKINLASIQSNADDDEDDDVELTEQDRIYKKKFNDLYNLMMEDQSDDDMDTYLQDHFPFSKQGQLNRSLPFHE
ncbi:hypothetical protein PPL_11561 [Heterostelium album PN500]|uniref:Uncharacterized protein n=1 Tax=Heterostelium pallidum (strain ATCC 26659 / Pp 5 / PN500) TaxID=670386 RepID=D3BVH0_HETP5|nr:hypothetical protein PPL_11561 [Heterostelium album PN500]EFA74593.1 hypothetical protein PPL_11561 [Heterostelium album PN500]|eukprot:XP_020426727.1 hypothetical protein PPL_11561 [Heterostelium album PN500]